MLRLPDEARLILEQKSLKLISVSSEFISLCRAQVALLTQGLGAALSVVYLTEELAQEGTNQSKLIPVVAYPETLMVWQKLKAELPLPETKESDRFPRMLSEAASEVASVQDSFARTNKLGPDELNYSLLPSRQIVLPLMHEDVLMGLLVTAREDRAWDERERNEIERIAETLTVARLLDQRREWLEQQLSQQQRLQAKQHDLLDNLLHQFRNPLTALRTFGKLLLKRLAPNDPSRAVADSIVRESDRLQELLQQFDQAINLTAKDLEPQKSLPPAALFVEATVEPVTEVLPLLPNTRDNTEVFPVVEILNPLLASALAIAQERNLDLQADIPPNLPLIKASAKNLREVLSNLIDNALKYTPAGGQISIQAGLERENFQGIAISDTGMGIPPQDVEHIFERHYRGIQANSEIPGTGLGLAIAKGLLEQMQGEIQVFSPALWHPNTTHSKPGTTFIVWLPVASEGTMLNAELIN